MIHLHIQFDSQWIEKQQAQGVRAVRVLEKWVSGCGGVRLKTSSRSGMSVELEEEQRPDFEKGLQQKIAETFGESDPTRIVSLSDSAAPRKRPDPEEARQPGGSSGKSARKPEGKARGKTAEKNAPGETAAAVSPEKVLSGLLQRVPFRHHRVLAAYLEETAQVVPMLRRMDAMDSFWGQSLLLAMDEGYGVTEFLEGLSELYDALGLLPGGRSGKPVREIRIGDGARGEDPLAGWERAWEAASDARRAAGRSGGGRGVLCLDVSAWQDRLSTPDIKSYLRRINAEAGNYTLVFRLPCVDAAHEKKTAAALADIFNIRILGVPPVDMLGLEDYAREELAKRSFRLDDGALPGFEQWVLEEKSDDSFFGYRTVDKMVRRMIYGKALADCKAGETDRIIRAEDILRHVAGGGASGAERDPRAELEALIGLAAVKGKVEEIVAQIKAQRKLAAKGKKVRRPAIHMLFTGNPGTGKTTVARIVARLLKREGVLRKGHLLEVKGRDLCGEYVGQTAPKTSAICRDAYGSVLFIDEAYALFRGDDSDRDYGREALDTLIAEMENHRDDLCVIMAGYPGEMDALMGGNTGLRSRIPYAVDFPNYSREELIRIFFAMSEGSFECEKGLEKALRDYFAQIPDEVMTDRDFSNARFVRNLYERTWGKAVCRDRLGEGNVKLLVSDLAGAAAEREFRKLLEKTVRKPIGFGA